MKFVIPLRRALPDALVKAAGFSRQAPGHKYLRRQRVFAGGRMTWRYFYEDEKQRETSRPHLDPTSAHEHHLVTDLPKLHENLKGKLQRAIDATVNLIRGLFNFHSKVADIAVVATPKWSEIHHAPFVAAEEKTGEGARAPQARVAKALELIPAHLKELVGRGKVEGDGGISRGLSKFVLTDMSEDELGMQAAGWYMPMTGEVHIIGGQATCAPYGEAKFRSNLTWTEVVVIHEFGHAVHHTIEAERPQVWEDWQKLSRTNGDRISNYAGKNVKEDFAESFACALAHPKELAISCPHRYEWMKEHVIPELKPLTEILDTPADDLAWWVGRKTTPAGKALNRAKQENPPRRYAPYYSDQDQFYIVNKDGRQLYLRVGPPDKESEAGWERMPATIDPVTGLPRYEGGLYNRFRAESTLKEVYDDHGKPLDDVQAYLYLGQDDPDTIEAVEKAGEDPVKAVTSLYEDKQQRFSLGRKMFDALGGNLGPTEKQMEGGEHLTPEGRSKISGTLEYERRRVDKARAKGETGEMGRHAWVPVEISAREFNAKSGTFKFGDVREASDDKQTWKLRDPKTSKSLTYYDPVQGRDRPQLAVRLYEQQNPDGTFTKILVNEQNAFDQGETIFAPQKRMRLTGQDGEVTVLSEAQWRAISVEEREKKYGSFEQQMITEWGAYKLGDTESTDPDVLARQFSTTARTLLEQNKRYGRGQILDPVLRALLDPAGRIQIRSAADLQALMREASESDPPRRAWVSIQGPAAHGTQMGVAHIQLEWDGAGPPRVVGDYWARKLDKDTIRVDELLDKNDEIALPRIIEKKARGEEKDWGIGGKPGEPGLNTIVWVKDPKTSKRVMAQYLGKKKTEGGGTVHSVQPLTGQGAGIERKVMVVDTIQPRLRREIPNVGKAGKVRRFVEPLEHELLLYADEVPIGSGPNEAGGVIRMLLPKDGSISYEQIMSMPGVQANIALDPDQTSGDGQAKGQPPLGISAVDLPKFRDRLGGFVMEGRVRAMLDQAMQQERALREKSTEAEVVETEDIVDDRGNLNPKGVCRGLVTGDEGIQPGPHRIKALKKMAKNGGRMMAAHFMGCVSGETLIPINRCGKGFTVSIRELCEKFNGPTWDPEHPTYASSVFGDHLRLNEILNVVPSGVKETYLLRTASGREIRATDMHPFWTPRGWLPLADLRPGDQVCVRGAVEPTGRAPKAYKYPYRTALWHHPFAGVRGAKKSPFRVPTHRLVAEARLNSLPLDTLVERCRSGNVAGLKFLDPAVYAVHHKDEDKLNNDPANLEVLPHVEHWRLHGENSGWTNFNQFRVGVDVVEFVGDEREEETFDIVMHVQSQSYVANEFVVHNTGKTAFAIMASQMMRNLRLPDGSPHPNQTKKKTLIVVPLNTAENWYQEFKRFAGAPPTLVGASTLAGAQQLPKLPERKDRESDDAFKKRVLDTWRAQCADDPTLWNPFADGNSNVVAPYEYFRDNEQALRLTGLFDGMVVDEAHKIARDNEISRAVERWNADMKLFLPMTGTPITNTLTTLPRIMRLVSNGAVDLGSDEQFESTYLVASSVLKALGAKNPPLTDLNPNMVGRLMALVQPYIDVANTTDVKGQMMPAVLLDENTPAHMIGQQATMYRAAMAKLTPADRAALESSAALGLDEQQMLSEDARRKVAVARGIANSPAYKAPDQREELTYEASVAIVDEKRGTTRIVPQNRPFKLPDAKQILSKKADGWGGKWPDEHDVASGRIQMGYLQALIDNSAMLFGVDYFHLLGNPINKDMFKAISEGSYVTETGQDWFGKIANVDYGPEGMISRGTYDPDTGEIKPLSYRYTDEHGHTIEETIPNGQLFVRDPNSKAKGLFYAAEDWDFTGRFEDTGEGGSGGSEGGDDEVEAVAKPGVKTRNQKPKEGREQHTIQRSVERRRQRAMFDVVVTHNNAKCDALEEWMKNTLSRTNGDPKGDLTQFILFGNRVGSSCRTMEAKLRTMGYQDVNEALGTAGVSSPEDKAKRPRKFFVTYMGKGATLGQRNLNSEIFRRKQDRFGKDLGVSMFVWRTLYGGTGNAPKLGEIREGWSRQEREDISSTFESQVHKKKDGTASGLEVPFRVMGVDDGKGNVTQAYCYESSLRPKERAEIRTLEVKIRSSAGTEQRKYEDRLREILSPHWTTQKPMTDHQQYVFNSTQVMLASDAANVGLNWPAAHLGMYDSLFSPMDEWQRITRAARMLPPAVSREAAPIVDKIDAWIRANEEKHATFSGPYAYDPKNVSTIYDYTAGTALAVVQEAIEQLPEADRNKLLQLPGGHPDQLVEAYFAKRSLERIQGLREEAEAKLRKEGYWPDPEQAHLLRMQMIESSDPQEKARLQKQLSELFIPAEAIQQSDVTNYILREQLSMFERKMMQDRRFLVDVKRFTTSVEVPELRVVQVEDPLSGKKKKVHIPTGQFVIESPSAAERAQLAQQRAKMVPYERFLRDVQNAVPAVTEFDFVGSTGSSMATTSTTDGDAIASAPEVGEGAIPFAGELAKGMLVPARRLRPRFYVRV